MTDPQSNQSMGLADSTTRVTFYADKADKAEWKRAAEHQGYTSLSKYLYELIQEAHILRQEGYLGPVNADQKLHELQEEVDRLETALEATQTESSPNTTGNSNSLQLDVDDPAFLKQVLTEEYQPFPEILQQIVESGVLDDLLRQPVEHQLYRLAAEDTVDYQRGHGWRLADTARSTSRTGPTTDPDTDHQTE